MMGRVLSLTLWSSPIRCVVSLAGERDDMQAGGGGARDYVRTARFGLAAACAVCLSLGSSCGSVPDYASNSAGVRDAISSLLWLFHFHLEAIMAVSWAFTKV